MLKYLLYTVIASSLFLVKARGQEMRFQSLSLKDGLSQISVLQIYEDSEGYLWFGTRNGLNRYNGYDFEVYRNEQTDPYSIGHNHITAICEANDGSLWVGTMMGLSIMDRYSGRFIRDLSGLAYKGDPFPVQQHIYTIYNDRYGRMWVATEIGLYIIDNNNATCKVVTSELLANNPVRAILENKNGELYLGTTHSGLIVLNKNLEVAQSFNHQRASQTSISSDFITSLVFDTDSILWVGTRFDGLNILPEGSHDFVRINAQNSTLSNNEIRCLEKGNNGELLVGTFDGLNIINLKDGNIQVYNQYRKREGDLNHFSIYSILNDKAGTIWIGSYSGGINYYSPFYHRFRFHDPGNEGLEVLGVVGPMIEHSGFIWIATEGGGLVRYDKVKEQYKYFRLESQMVQTYNENIIKSLFLDGDTIWCGTAKGSIYSFDIKRETFRKRHELSRSDVIYALHKDRHGNLFVGSIVDRGLVMIKPDGSQLSEFPLKDGATARFSDVRVFYEISADVYLIGTRYQGLYQFNLQQQTLYHFSSEVNTPGDYITSILKSSDGRIWVGTFGDGFGELMPEVGFIRMYSTKNGLLSNNICSIQEGDNGNLWISTTSGLTEFNASNSIFRNYTNYSGIRVNEFTLHASLRSSSGELFFSGNNGFISFNSSNIISNVYVPPVYLTELTVNNRYIRPLDESGILEFPLAKTSAIILNHSEANFTLSYNALNYIYPERNMYAYMLEGFDDSWVDAGDRRTAYYTNIPSGTYTFRVKASNNDGVWNESGTSIQIIVKPAWWKTKLAYAGYFLTFSLLFGAVLRYYKVKHRLETDLLVKQLEKQTLEEFHQERMQLFTNFSHELRTPLTLILGPLEELLNKVNNDLNLQETYRLMHRNTMRIYNLVNQLMDFRKKEQGKLSLNLNVCNYYSFISEIVVAFSALGKSRNMGLTLKCTYNPGDSLFDPELMEKVFFNLLSNSFKNTPDGGSIDIDLILLTKSDIKSTYPDKYQNLSNASREWIGFEVSDTGKGIDEDELEKIFDPFYQIKKGEHDNIAGTGLGLSLCRGIVELHSGFIWAGHNLPGGAKFFVLLPIIREGATDKKRGEKFQEPSQFIIEPTVIKNILPVADSKKFTILIVEDNAEVRDFLEHLLNENYQVIKADNGKEAFSLAEKYLPDLILSDIMMPKMDGLEFCTLIKQNVLTAHIPVILITARSSFLQIREGFETGADDYITKPFSGSILQLKIRNLIVLREKMKELYGKRFSAESLGIQVVSADENFLRIISEFIHRNISNPDLNIDLFCNEVAMSRANLYRKIKAVTGFSPTEFVRNVRLETAASLLKETDLPVSEIAEKVGFNSLSYFSNCFKVIYHQSPKEYQSSRRSNS